MIQFRTASDIYHKLRQTSNVVESTKDIPMQQPRLACRYRPKANMVRGISSTNPVIAVTEHLLIFQVLHCNTAYTHLSRACKLPFIAAAFCKAKGRLHRC